VGVDLRVELLTIVFRLAGNPEYQRCDVPRYAAALDAYFAPFRDHEAVELARALRNSRGAGYDAPMSLAVHLTDAAAPRPRIAFAEARALDPRWRDPRTAPFVRALRRFVTDSRAEAFFASQRALHDSAAARLGRLLEAGVDFAWFDRFFGERAGAAFHAVAGVCNGGNSFGVRFVRGRREELYAVLGVFRTDSAGWPLFPPAMVGTVIHEFSHSYVNPTLARAERELGRGAEALYAATAAAMRAQAYGSAATVLNETFVRAATIRYLLAHDGEDAARAATLNEQGRGFVWMPEAVVLLGAYERDRERYPTFAAFLPRIAAWTDSVGPHAAALVAAYEARRPRVVSITPADGAVDVDPATTTFTVRFDRRMRRSYSINLGPGGRATFPDITGAAWDSTGTVFTLSVELQPGRSYEFRLNRSGGGGFVSEEGVALAERVVRFGTRE
jgi:hypothetical protein